MKITVTEMVELTNQINKASHTSYQKGVMDERGRPLPNTLFDALLDYAKKSETLIDCHTSMGPSDGCNWLQIKPTRAGAEGTKYVEISFEENLMEISHIGIVEQENHD